ncbi:hypothetical protein M9458_002226, partial [Cirrhinus mrigala]
SADDHAGDGYGDQSSVQSTDVSAHQPPNQPSTLSLQHIAAQPVPRHPSQPLRKPPTQPLCSTSPVHVRKLPGDPPTDPPHHLNQHHPQQLRGATGAPEEEEQPPNTTATERHDHK